MNKKGLNLPYLPYALALGLFLALLIAGFLLYKDFGVPIDETYQLQVAQKNHSYIFHKDPSLLSFKDRYYGVVFELPLFWASTRFSGPDMVHVRHLLLYLAFFASTAIFYFISLRLFRSPWWSLVAACFLAASPRFFSDAFYNSKDIAFMDVFILAIGTLLLVIDKISKPGWTNPIFLVCLHALTSALLIGTRIVGIMILPMSIFFYGATIFGVNHSWKKFLGLSTIYFTLAAGFTVLLWPVLWHDPFHEAINAFQQMSKYTEYGKGVLYLGNFHPSDALPLHYVPVWIGISTPLIVLSGFVIGFSHWVKGFYLSFQRGGEGYRRKFANFASDQEALHWMTIFAWLTIPIVAVYTFNSVLYNGWRHLFFIYPAVVLFSTRGFSAVHGYFLKRTEHHNAITVLMAIVLIGGLIEPVLFIAKHYRYGTVYFNSLAGDPQTLRQRFEMDYWGLSYKEAIDYILATDTSEKIPIYMADVSGPDYIKSGLSPEDKARIAIMESPDTGARYFIGNYSFHPGEYEYAEFIPEYYSVNVRGAKILVVYRFQEP